MSPQQRNEQKGSTDWLRCREPRELGTHTHLPRCSPSRYRSRACDDDGFSLLFHVRALRRPKDSPRLSAERCRKVPKGADSGAGSGFGTLRPLCRLPSPSPVKGEAASELFCVFV